MVCFGSEALPSQAGTSSAANGTDDDGQKDHQDGTGVANQSTAEAADEKTTTEAAGTTTEAAP